MPPKSKRLPRQSRPSPSPSPSQLVVAPKRNSFLTRVGKGIKAHKYKIMGAAVATAVGAHQLHAYRHRQKMRSDPIYSTKYFAKIQNNAISSKPWFGFTLFQSKDPKHKIIMNGFRRDAKTARRVFNGVARELKWKTQ
jgi:hypothetical protein